MKKAFLMVLTGCMLMACHTDLDLKNIDTTAQVEMGVAVPVGSLRVKLGDILGDTLPNLYIDSANGGVLTLRFAIPDGRGYHHFDIKDHPGATKDTLYVYDPLDKAGLLWPDGSIKGTGLGIDIPPVTLPFKFPIKLFGINTDLKRERLDSAMIDLAQFSAILQAEDLPVQWEWIDSIELVLGDNVYRQAGNTKTIYHRDRNKGGFGQKLMIEIDNFSINLMKDRSLSIEKNTIEDYANNIDSALTFGLNITIDIPKNAEKITLTKESGFICNMGVEFIDYKAIWGYFDPEKDMISKKVEIDLEPYLGSLGFFEQICTPFTDPRIDVAVTTQIAGAMVVQGKDVYVIGKDGDSIFATFDNQGTRHRLFRMQPWMHPDPTKPGSELGASITDTISFSKAEDEGHIDRLFSKIPRKLGYDFIVHFDSDTTPQLRMTSDTVAIDAKCTLPLKFGEGLHIAYKDTIREVDLSAVDIDSLIRESEVIKSLNAGEVTLFVTALSEIPMSVKAVLTYLDSAGQPIKDPTDPTQLFNPFRQDTLRLAPPRFEQNAEGEWKPVKNTGKSVFTAHMTKEQLEIVPNIKRIVYKVIVDNEALNYAFHANPGLSEVALTKDQSVELNMGLTAHIDAILDFNSKQ